MSDIEVDEMALYNAIDTPSVSPIKAKPKRRNYAKKVEHEWSHEETLQLIAAVEERRELWDVGTPEYKLPKSNSWKEVTNLIGNIKADEAKAKWTNLRISFKNNLAKYRLKKSGQSTGEAVVIHWRYFKCMMFLEANDIRQSTESTSSLALASENTDALVLEEFPVATPLSPGVVGKRKRRANPGSLPTSSPTPRFNVMRELAFKALSSIRVHDDPFSSFGDYIASELRALPPDRGTFVKRGLNRELLRLLEAATTDAPLLPQQSFISPVRFIDANGCDINPATVNPNEISTDF